MGSTIQGLIQFQWRVQYSCFPLTFLKKQKTLKETLPGPQETNVPIPVPEEVLQSTTVADWIAKDGQQAIERSQNGTDDLDLRVHSDLRNVNWTFVVAPSLEPIECFSASLQKCNKNVLQIAALNLVW